MASGLSPLLTGAVRTSAADPGYGGPVVLGLVGLVIVVAIGWLVRGRERPGPLLALVPAVALVAWTAGSARLGAALATTNADMTLSDRVVGMFGALSLAVDVWIVGGAATVTLLVAIALLFALRGRAHELDRAATARRWIGLAAGFVGLIGVIFVCATPLLRGLAPYRLGALLAAPISAAGIVFVFIASRAGQRARHDTGLAALASCSAILVMVPLVMLADAAAIGELYGTFDVDQTPRIAQELAREQRLLAPFVLLFLVPILVSTFTTTRPKLEGGMRILGPALAAAVCFGGAYLRIGREMDSAVVLLSTTTKIQLPTITASCNELPASRLVHLDERHIMGKGFDVPFAVDGSCDDVVAKLVTLNGKDDLWLAVDPKTPFERVGCVFDTLGQMRGDAAGSSEPKENGCVAHFVGQTASGPVCDTVYLPDPRCFGPRSPDLEPERHLHVLLTNPISFEWRQGWVLVSQLELKDPNGFEAKVLMEWKMMGNHRDAMDRKLDHAVLKGAPDLPFELFATRLGQMENITREYRARSRSSGMGDPHRDGPSQRSVFEIAVASLHHRPIYVTDPASIPSFDMMTPATTRDARDVCGFGGCPRSVRAQLTLAATFERRRGASPLPWAMAEARALDPAVVIPPPPSPDAGAPPVGRSDDKRGNPPEHYSAVVSTTNEHEPALDAFIAELEKELRFCAVHSAGEVDVALVLPSRGPMHTTSLKVLWEKPERRPLYFGTVSVESCVLDALLEASLVPRPRSTLRRANLHITLTRDF